MIAISSHSLSRNFFKSCDRMLLFVCVVFITAMTNEIHAQNLEKIGKKDMVTIGGSMNMNAVFYDAQGFIPRRDPFTWYFNGSLNITILDVALPFTYSYSNRQGNYTQPFNMQSCSPKYKWIQAHIGTTTVAYSPYTLSGHVFTGAAIELTPKGFFIGAMYGRLKKSVAYNAIAQSDENMSYKRMGYAFKTGFESGEHSITASYFHAIDDRNSLVFIPSSSSLTPMENTVVGLTGKTKVLKCITLEGEFALSALTRNVDSEMETTEVNGIYKWMIATCMTTEYYKAYKISIGYTSKMFAITANHEHVDPGYSTLGAYYFNNDLENWTLAPTMRLWKGKMSVSVNTGFQRNNLAADRLATTQRWVGSAAINLVPSQKWMVNATYSNFSSYTRNRPQADPFWTPSPADTLSFYQIAQQGNATVSYSFGEKKIKNTISCIASYQITGQQQSGNILPATEIMNGNISWSLQWKKSKLTATSLINFSRSVSETYVTEQAGPGIQISKSMSKNRLRLSGGVVYNRSLVNNVLFNNVMNYRSQISFAPKVRNEKTGRPNFSMNAVFVQRFPLVTGLEKTGELTVTMNAGYAF